MATCYRHRDRETGVSCSNCGNPICTDCMTATPVGMRCPDCARQKTKVRTAATIRRGGDPIATYVLMAISILVFLGGGGGMFGSASGPAYEQGALYGPLVSQSHEYWRLITYGFLHSGLLHIGFNMYILYYLGTMLEPALQSELAPTVLHVRSPSVGLSSQTAPSVGGRTPPSTVH